MKHGFIISFLCYSITLSHNEEIQENVCTDLQFHCSNGQCIDKESVCNGANDCVDGSDELETYCKDIRCPYYAFRCAYGACIDGTATCNGLQDCVDNSDELLPECGNKTTSLSKLPCKYNEFVCNTGQCIDGFLICDGEDDCYDGSDETLTHCVNMQCPSYGFQCDYGGCINQDHKCDGVDDCKDASDETRELCNKKSRKRKRPPKPPMPVNIPSNDPAGGCHLPPRPNGGRYELYSLQEKREMFQGDLVSNRTVLKYYCNDGYVLSGKTLISCDQGKWDPEPQDCKKMCSGLKSTSVDMRCEFKGETCPCNERVPPGTKMFPQCKPSYNLPNADITFRHTECLEDGQWAHNLFNCVPECGIRSSGTVHALMTYARPVKETYPWHVALYYKTYFLCGATIITPFAVLTAAHCVSEDKTGQLFNRTDITVAVGKYRRSLKVEDPQEKRFGVDAIYVKETYKGATNLYENDIAILELNGIIELSAYVMPICIDEFDMYKLYLNSSQLGFVVGWGLTEENVLSGVLRVGEFRYHNFTSCHDSLFKFIDFTRYITSDKFCTEVTGRTRLTPGDSGGALQFIRKTNDKEKSFIYGIVSLGHDDNRNFTTFTNITHHLNWINHIKIEIKNNFIRKGY